ncbi:DnaJ domain-containing protein [Sphingomonas sp. HDW15A]|uniref:J domain-containing protein n=1 Tax=Sphingomonas sp. HDW15A TaxID=2714942 RepID=UPI00140D04E8|nr:J domain-containing protein [Sphingomonas sp. HDW15A]QIK96201.1 DnaJ domain-containing protein [Sphingomonas sp. HDW15A]
MADHYRTLGIAPTADEAVIRAVYVALMKRFHPDRNASPDMLKRAQDITAAYAVLSDPKKRAAYDDERAGMDPWTRGAALPERRKSSTSGLALAVLTIAVAAGAFTLWPMIPIANPVKRSPGTTALTPVTMHCAGLADSERIRTALIARLDEVGALDRTAAAALTASRFELAAPTDARDLAAPGQVACLATLAITLPTQFSTASGQGTILSELQFSTSRTDPGSVMRIHPDGRLVAALSAIRHQPRLAAVSNPMLEEDVVVADEPPIPVNPAVRRPVPNIAPLPVRKAASERPAAPATARIAEAPRQERIVGLNGIDRQTMNFYGQSLRNASAVKKSKLEASHAGFIQRLAACGSDSCRRDAYLERNVEISRIMMGE